MKLNRLIAVLLMAVLAMNTVEAAENITATESIARENGATGETAKNHREENKQLAFNKDGKFKIVQFTDVHWIAGNPKSDVAGVMMNEILDAEKPDLVIYTGDIIYGGVAEDGLRKALEPTISRGIPFAVTFGNHDDEHNLNRQQVYEFIKGMPGNLTSSVEGLKGITNFILNVKSAEGDKDAATLYVFDSNSYSTIKGVKGYGWIGHDQVQWYIENSRNIKAANGGDTIPALAFFHIPLPEYFEAVKEGTVYMYGNRMEKVCCPEINTGLFAAMLESGDILGTFAGHDHINDYAVKWKGIMLCYGRYSGGSTVYHGIPGGNGARVIELTQGEKAFRSWIRLKEGKVINEFKFPSELIKK